MRAELVPLGVSIPDEEGLRKLSAKYNKWLARLRASQFKTETSAFHILFNEIDKDGSGDITFDELVEVTRLRLKKKEDRMPLTTLKALFCALDKDDSNSIRPNEVASWLRMGIPKKTPEEKEAKRQRKAEKAARRAARAEAGGGSTPGS